MKLYHVDRSGLLKENMTLDLIKDIHYEDKFHNEAINFIGSSYYKDGISSHGRQYLLNNINNNSMVMDVIFEYERLLNYPNKLSRYKSFYAFDKQGLIEFTNRLNQVQEFYKIYEVESNYFEKYNMNSIRGDRHFNIAMMAKIYWENRPNPLNEIVLYEYLLELPVKIIKEVNINEI